jgi:hypothetical protein
VEAGSRSGPPWQALGTCQAGVDVRSADRPGGQTGWAPHEERALLLCGVPKEGGYGTVVLDALLESLDGIWRRAGHEQLEQEHAARQGPFAQGLQLIKKWVAPLRDDDHTRGRSAL